MKVSEKSWGKDNQWGQMTGGWRLLDGQGAEGQERPGGTQGTGGGNQAAGGRPLFQDGGFQPAFRTLQAWEQFPKMFWA